MQSKICRGLQEELMGTDGGAQVNGTEISVCRGSAG